jgi:hypothetical protein
MLYKGAGSREFNLRQTEATDATLVGLPARLDAVVHKGHETGGDNDTANG